MNCLQCRAHWFFTALEKLLMNSTEVSGENLALKRRHPASTPPPPAPSPNPLSPQLSSTLSFQRTALPTGEKCCLKFLPMIKKKGLKKCKAWGTACSHWMWKYTLWLDSFYIWSISFVPWTKAWTQEETGGVLGWGQKWLTCCVLLYRRLMKTVSLQDTVIKLKAGGGVVGKITFVAYLHIPTYIHRAKANSLRTSYSFFSSAIPFSALKFHSSTFEEWERGGGE